MCSFVLVHKNQCLTEEAQSRAFSDVLVIFTQQIQPWAWRDLGYGCYSKGWGLDLAGLATDTVPPNIPWLGMIWSYQGPREIEKTLFFFSFKHYWLLAKPSRPKLHLPSVFNALSDEGAVAESLSLGQFWVPPQPQFWFWDQCVVCTCSGQQLSREGIFFHQG